MRPALNWLAVVRSRWRSFRASQPPEWSPGGIRWDLAALLLILILAAAARLVDLSSVPTGMQGDEAAAGLEAHRIRDEGWSGVYTPAAAGNPTGFYYLVAVSTSILGDSILAVRITSAVIGILTVAALYVLLRRNLGFISAASGSALLSLSLWHVIFSRLGHVTVSWPLVAVLMTISLIEALKTESWRWWGLSGAFLALGIYLYNGHIFLLTVVLLFAAFHLFGWRGCFAAASLGIAVWHPGWPALAVLLLAIVALAFSPRVRATSQWTNATAFGAALAVIAFPMVRFVTDHRDDYFGRGRALSLFNSAEWAQQTSRTGKARLLFDRYVDVWEMLSFNPVPSVVDLTGVVPIVTPAALALSAAGLVLGLTRRFGPLVQLGALIVLTMPIAPAMFVDVALRRELVIVPFLAMFAGIAVAEILRLSRRRRWDVKIGGFAVVILVLSLITYRNVTGFATTMDSQSARWTLGPELVETTSYLDALPSDAYVYFFAIRWPFHHEVIRYLSPEARGETRGAPYGPDSIEIDPAKGQPVFVLIGEYQRLLPEIQARYPGGTIVEGPVLTDPVTGPTYIAYVLPAQP